MTWVESVVAWLASVTGWPVYPSVLPDGATYGVAYEATEEGDPTHDEDPPGERGTVTVTLFVFHQRLSIALSKARDIVHNIGDLSVSDGHLRGGQVVSREIGYEPVSELRFVMLRLRYHHQEV